MDEPGAPRFTDPMGMAAGRFCTMINIGHTPEFFALDLRCVTPEGEACLLGRYFLTPPHAKRLLQALADNVEGFEAQYGTIAPTPNGADPGSSPTN